jgi:ubiquinone/menaquinone biosynthesis C-methylase UbiE
VTRHARLGELLLGIHGLALLRGIVTGSDADASSHVDEIRRIATSGDDALLAASTEFPERSVERGYADWSKTYDLPGNPLIHLEETVLVPLLDALTPGRALDAACGTGRVSARLAAAGHDVVGVDATPEMLELARAKVPGAEFVEGRLEALPVEDGGFDLVVCCLALDHCADVGPPIAELARAARPGGRVVISDIHPTMIHLGGQAAYVDERGAWAFVRGHAHLHSEYLSALSAAGLEVDQLFEPPPNQGWFEMQKVAWSQAPTAFRQAYGGIPAAIVWSLVKT